MLTLGIDSGSTTTKGALFDGEKIVRTAILPTSANPKDSITKLYDILYNQDVPTLYLLDMVVHCWIRQTNSSQKLPAMQEVQLS